MLPAAPGSPPLPRLPLPAALGLPPLARLGLPPWRRSRRVASPVRVGAAAAGSSRRWCGLGPLLQAARVAGGDRPEMGVTAVKVEAGGGVELGWR